jgi:hypothetical protein
MCGIIFYNNVQWCKMNHNEALYKGSRVRERATFSYDTTSGEPDLKEQLLKLKAMKNCPYWNRSLADIAGMILLENVPKEIARYEGPIGRAGIGPAKVR